MAFVKNTAVSSVLFVMKTQEIKTTDVTADDTDGEEKTEKSFWDKLKGLF